MLIIGERLNSSNSAVKELLETRDSEALLARAGAQLEAGAAWIDVNASMLMEGEKEALVWAGETILGEFDCGISIDSPDLGILEHGASVFAEDCIINSLTVDEEALARMPGMISRGASVILMLKTSAGIPDDAEGRFELARRAAEAAEEAGADPGRVFLDPVFEPAATSGGLMTALETLWRLRDGMPRHHRIGGLSNVSYGLPMRRTVNRTFLAMAIASGLDSVICDPTDRRLLDTIAASRALTGDDSSCRELLARYRARKKD